MSQSLALRFASQLGTRAVDTRPSSWREEDLSIEAVAATATPTRMRVYEYDREYGGYRSREYDEALDIDGLTDAEISAFVGCPVLDSHSAWSTMTVVGVIDEAKREGAGDAAKLVVRMRLSKTEDDLVSKVRDGILRKVSLGYQRKAGAVITEREGDVPLRKQPFIPAELSLVAFGADAGAGTRSASNLDALHHHTPVNPTQEPAMNVDAIRSAMTAFTTAMTAALATETPTAPVADGQRAADPATPAVPTPPAAPAAPAPSAPVPPSAPGQRSAEDLALIGGLRSIAASYGKGAEFDALAAAGEPIDGLRSLAGGYAKTASVSTNTTLDGAPGQRSEDRFLSHDEAATGRRSGDDAVTALASALAGFVAR